MNRKQIVNELFSWPEITEEESARLVASIIAHLQKYPELKRKKTPPKAKRDKLKKKASADSGSSVSSTTAPQPVKSEIKDCLRLGLNSVTKSLEEQQGSSSSQTAEIKFVLVCRSCKPLIVLTRHIQVMCSYRNIPAGCVYNLSESLGKLFNVKKVSALAFYDSGTHSEAIKRLSTSLSSEIIPLLKPITNPFTAQPNLKIIDIDESVLREKPVEQQADMMMMVDEQEAAAQVDDKSNNNNQFGSDYISFNSSTNNQIPFDSPHFILFRDDYVPPSLRQNTMSHILDGIENDLRGFGGHHHHRFNQLSLITKTTRGSHRSGDGKKKKDLKGKKMKALEKNKFKVK